MIKYNSSVYPIEMTQTRIFKIQNLDCTGCIHRIHSALKGIKGIVEVKSNLFLRELYVKWKEISEKDLRKTIISAGYILSEDRNPRKYLAIAAFIYVIQQISPIFPIKLISGSLMLACYCAFTAGPLTGLSHISLLQTDRILAAAAVSLLAGLFCAISQNTHANSFLDSSAMLLIFKLLGLSIADWVRSMAMQELYSMKSGVQGQKVFEIGKEYPVDGEIGFDGVVVEGEGYVDESGLSGEAFPVYKRKGSEIFCGTSFLKSSNDSTRIHSIHNTCSLRARVSKIGRETRIGQILDSIVKVHRTDDTNHAIFEKCVKALSILVFSFWFIAGTAGLRPELLYRGGSSPFIVALIRSLNCIAISCPCVFSIAEPFLYLRVYRLLRKEGFIVKDLDFIRRDFKDCFIDKTGTLLFQERVVSIEKVADKESAAYGEKNENNETASCYPHEAINGNGGTIGSSKGIFGSNDKVLEMLSSLEMEDNHPTAAVINRYLAELGIRSGEKPEKIKRIPGRGIKCKFPLPGNGVPLSDNDKHGCPRSCSTSLVFQDFRVGNKEFIFGGQPSPDNDADIQMLSDGTQLKKILYISCDFRCVGRIHLMTEIRKGARGLVDYLKQEGLNPAILTGDSQENSVEIAGLLGIKRILAGQSPLEKLLSVSDSSIFIGDGTNDSPALLKAGLGVSVDSQNDSASAVLLKSSLDPIIYFLSLTRKAKRKLVFNQILSCVFNFVSLPFIAGLFVPFGLVVDVRASCLCMLLSLGCLLLSVYFL